MNYNIYRDFQCCISIPLKIAEDQIVRDIVLARTTYHTLLLGLESILLLGLVVT